VVQGAENDLIDIRFVTETTPVIWFRTNEPFEDLNTNILIVDNKAILARSTAQATEASLATHIGSVGLVEHAAATTGLSGFMTAADKVKLNGIQTNAQLNILSPTDAIELISLGETTLHEHPLATSTLDGYMTIADKLKLDGIQAGAQVNNITVSQKNTLTGGGNADSLHSHGFSVGSETFTAAVHAVTNHAGIPGVEAFPGFSVSSYQKGAAQINPGTTIYTRNYGGTFSSLEAISADHARMLDFGVWGAAEQFRINDVSITGSDGTVVYEVAAGGGIGDMLFQCWQVGYGIP